MELNNKQYVGRFAPSPSGGLHLGSVVTATASYIRAKQRDGRWLLRIDDLDRKREKTGARDLILKTLDSLSLKWDGISFQRDNYLEYRNAIKFLQNAGFTYRCVCPRKSLPVGRYPGICRELKIGPNEIHGIRLKVVNSVQLLDVLYGTIEEDINLKHGDFLIKTRDREATYHLAVVIDDTKAGVSEVVRGADLLSSTPLHIYVYEKLGYPCPDFFHIPLVKNKRGIKLSKQTGANPIDVNNSKSALLFALGFLGFDLPASLRSANCQRLLQWATYESNISVLEAVQSRFLDEMKNVLSSS